MNNDLVISLGQGVFPRVVNVDSHFGEVETEQKIEVETEQKKTKTKTKKNLENEQPEYGE